MITDLAREDVERFRGAVLRRLGLAFDDGKLGLLAEVLQRRLAANDGAASLYLDRLEGAQPPAEELRALARTLTVTESYFFRHVEQLNAFVDLVASDWPAGRRLHVLSAGCASGEEPYSLAILLRERLAERAREASIRAVDINPAMLARAAQGRFSSWALRETAPEARRRWFHASDGEFALHASIREAVTFEERNLSLDDPELWPAQGHDIVFCRNVMMYFTFEGARALVARITGSLAPGGHLFLGHAETLRGLSQDFHLCHTHGAFYYRRKEGRSGERDSDRPPEWPPLRGAPPPVGYPIWSSTWIETIQRATERIHALTEPPAARSPEPPPRAAAAPARPQIDAALELLARERYTEALDLVATMAPELSNDPDLLLLRAALLTHAGQLGPAESTCARILEHDELNAGAHYLLALCRERAGDLSRAIKHDQFAVYLDAAFAMPHLHLGLMARRSGERETARRELAEAIARLQHEDAARIHLFGGGFSRSALIALCGAELEGLAGAP